MHSHVFQRISTEFGMWYPYTRKLLMRVGVVVPGKTAGTFHKTET